MQLKEKNTCSQSLTGTNQLCVVRISWRIENAPLPKRTLDFILSLTQYWYSKATAHTLSQSIILLQQQQQSSHKSTSNWNRDLTRLWQWKQRALHFLETSQLSGAVFRPFQTLYHQVAVKQLPIIPHATFLSCNWTPTASLSGCQSENNSYRLFIFAFTKT